MLSRNVVVPYYSIGSGNQTFLELNDHLSDHRQCHKFIVPREPSESVDLVRNGVRVRFDYLYLIHCMLISEPLEEAPYVRDFVLSPVLLPAAYHVTRLKVGLQLL